MWSLSSTLTSSQPVIQRFKPHLAICVYIELQYTVVVSGKGKGVPVSFTKAYWCVDLQLHSFLSVVIDRVKWSLVGPRSLYVWGRSPLYPVDRRVGGPWGWSELFSKRKPPCPCLGIAPLVILEWFSISEIIKCYL